MSFHTFGSLPTTWGKLWMLYKVSYDITVGDTQFYCGYLYDGVPCKIIGNKCDIF
jgi:hypothetical protein